MFAEKIYTGRHIHTMNDAQPTAEAVAVAGGKILKVGSLAEMTALKGVDTQVVELGERALLPGFIDCHGHLGLEVIFAEWADLQPISYGGTIRCMDDLVAAMKRHISDYHIPAGEWAVGWGYSHVNMTEGRHPTKFDLDKVSTEHPIIVWHTSQHFFVANTLGLAKLGIDEHFVAPEGAHITCVAGTNEPNGLCEGTVRYQAVAKLPMGNMDDLQRKLHKAVRMNNSFGITTIQEGGSRMVPDIMVLKEAMKRGELDTDIVCFPIEKHAECIADPDLPKDRYVNHVRMAGLKMVADGSFSGTAKMSAPYPVRPEGTPDGFDGLMYVTPEETKEFLKLGMTSGQQTMYHMLGDGCTQIYLDAYREALAETGVDCSKRRDVALHYVFSTAEQSKQVEEMNIFPSLLSVRTYYSTKADEERYGFEKLYNSCRAKDFVDTGRRFTIHVDAPCFVPNILHAVYCIVNRISMEGTPYNPELRISVLDGLKAVTIHAAHQYFEEDTKGSLETGKLADLVILDRDPLEIDPMELKDIKVLETIKEGKSVYTA